VKVNVHGMENVVRASQAGGVKKVLFTSSDKAVNPTSVMGTTKLMGERLITAAQQMTSARRPTQFASTRFGNVVGSRGSVFPLFIQQIAKGGPVTLTHEDMTRFMMTLDEAASLVIDSIHHTQGGEIFITKMPVMRIIDVAEVLVDMMAPYFGRDPKDIEIKMIGMRPGEKLYEELSTAEELSRMWDCGRFFVVDPLNVEAGRKYPTENPVRTDRVYISETEPAMGHESIREFIENAGVLPADYKPVRTPPALAS
jgi:FlaA1/EpsC-like NDP-sugar epimerase